MTSAKKPTRQAIIQTLTKALRPLDYVHAFYESGATSWNRIDKWSDIDLYIITDDDKTDETFQTVEKTLKTLSPIKQKYDVPQTGWQGVSQAFYRLENTSEYLLIDLAILTLSTTEKFLEPKIHGKPLFHFNKNNKVKAPPFDQKAFTQKIKTRLEKLQARSSMFNHFIQKEINRNNTIEALDLYHNLTLATLIEALRIKHNPLHHDFQTKYIHYELPPKTIKKLTRLYFVKDKKDLQKKYIQATEWFHQTIKEINQTKTVSSANTEPHCSA